MYADVWGFDDSAVAVLQNMKLSSEHEGVTPEVPAGLEKYTILLKNSLSYAEVSASAGDDSKAQALKLLQVTV